MIKAMLIAGCGGFVGTCGRYLVGKWCSGMFHGSFPMGTFLVNIIGCFIIGLFFGLLEKAHVMTPGENVLLITGFCGGFTTFSSFADDMWILGSKGDWTTFAIYLALSVILGVLLVWGGRALIRCHTPCQKLFKAAMKAGVHGGFFLLNTLAHMKL